VLFAGIAVIQRCPEVANTAFSNKLHSIPAFRGRFLIDLYNIRI